MSRIIKIFLEDSSEKKKENTTSKQPDQKSNSTTDMTSNKTSSKASGEVTDKTSNTNSNEQENQKKQPSKKKRKKYFKPTKLKDVLGKDKVEELKKNAKPLTKEDLERIRKINEAKMQAEKEKRRQERIKKNITEIVKEAKIISFNSLKKDVVDELYKKYGIFEIKMPGGKSITVDWQVFKQTVENFDETIMLTIVYLNFFIYVLREISLQYIRLKDKIRDPKQKLLESIKWGNDCLKQKKYLNHNPFVDAVKRDFHKAITILFLVNTKKVPDWKSMIKQGKADGLYDKNRALESFSKLINAFDTRYKKLMEVIKNEFVKNSLESLTRKEYYKLLEMLEKNGKYAIENCGNKVIKTYASRIVKISKKKYDEIIKDDQVQEDLKKFKIYKTDYAAAVIGAVSYIVMYSILSKKEPSIATLNPVKLVKVAFQIILKIAKVNSLSGYVLYAASFLYLASLSYLGVRLGMFVWYLVKNFKK